MKPSVPRHKRQAGRATTPFRSRLDFTYPDLQASQNCVRCDKQLGDAAGQWDVDWLPNSRTCAEIFLISSVVPVVMLWIAAQGPWAPYALLILYLLPLLLGLRYGFAAGVASAVLTAISLVFVAMMAHDTALAAPRAQAIGLVLVGMVAGHASEIWTARIRRLSALARYHQARLDQFTSAYHLLEVSHAQLEQRVAGGIRNLRNALQALKQNAPLRNAQVGEPLGGIAREILDIMVEQGDLYTAAVYALNHRNLLQLPPLAKAGDTPELSVFNPLLRETLRTGLLTSVKAGDEAGYEQVIAVVPLVDSSGHIHGVVVINDMPFLAVNLDTFGLLGVLGKHIGDILSHLTHPIDQTDSVAGLNDSLQRHLVDAREYGVPSVLLAFCITSVSRSKLLVTHCCKSGRGLDEGWIGKNRQGYPVIFKLLPLTNETGAITFANRLQWENVGGRSAKSGMVIHRWMLGQHRDAGELLTQLLRDCDIDDREPKPAVAPRASDTKVAV